VIKLSVLMEMRVKLVLRFSTAIKKFTKFSGISSNVMKRKVRDLFVGDTFFHVVQHRLGQLNNSSFLIRLIRAK